MLLVTTTYQVWCAPWSLEFKKNLTRHQYRYDPIHGNAGYAA